MMDQGFWQLPQVETISEVSELAAVHVRAAVNISGREAHRGISSVLGTWCHMIFL